MYVCINKLLVGLFVSDTSINADAMVLTSSSVQVTWNALYLSCVIGYLISYSTSTSYPSSENVFLDDVNRMTYNLTNLEECTEYDIIVHVISDTGTNYDSNRVTITTYADSKYYIKCHYYT